MNSRVVLNEYDIIIECISKKIDAISDFYMNGNNISYNVYRPKRALLSYSIWTVLFSLLKFDKSASCDQDTDGLHKALEASILRNEVLSTHNFTMFWACLSMITQIMFDMYQSPQANIIFFALL